MRTDRERLDDAIEAIDRCLSRATAGRKAFEADPLLQVWMVHHLEILGEGRRAGRDPFDLGGEQLPPEPLRADPRWTTVVVQWFNVGRAGP